MEDHLVEQETTYPKKHCLYFFILAPTRRSLTGNGLLAVDLVIVLRMVS